MVCKVKFSHIKEIFLLYSLLLFPQTYLMRASRVSKEQLELRRCIIRGGRRNRFSDLPESVLVEILYRLPVKSVFKFKSVSKYWLSLISDPVFARSYFSRRITITNYRKKEWTILYHYDGTRDIPQEDYWLRVLDRGQPTFKSPSFTLSFFSEEFNFKLPCFNPRYTHEGIRDDGKAPARVLAVSNGLLLSVASRTWHDCYYVCNPLTKQWSALPKPPRIHKWVCIYLYLI